MKSADAHKHQRFFLASTVQGLERASFSCQLAMRTFIAIAFWCSLIGLTVASLVPVDLLPPQALNIWDKAQHAAGFAWLAWLGLWAYPRHARTVLMGLIAWGGSIELMQMATGWRYGEWIDWLADAIGVFAAWLAWRLLPWHWTGRHTTSARA